MPALQRELGLDNVMQVPRLDKIVVNMGIGDAVKDGRLLEAALEDLTIITGQKPVVTKARPVDRRVQAARRHGDRRQGPRWGNRMWEFYDRLVSLALPRIRDFQGMSPSSFDGTATTRWVSPSS